MGQAFQASRAHVLVVLPFDSCKDDSLDEVFLCEEKEEDDGQHGNR